MFHVLPTYGLEWVRIVYACTRTRSRMHVDFLGKRCSKIPNGIRVKNTILACVRTHGCASLCVGQVCACARTNLRASVRVYHGN